MAISELLFLDTSPLQEASDVPVPEMIRILRKHLGMDIAFIGEFINGNREIKLVDSDEKNCPVQIGLCTPEQESYCKLIIDGKLPHVMGQVENYPVAAALPVTKELDIKSYLAAPIQLSDGTVYGTLCCYSHVPEPSLNKRDLGMMKACAEMTARQIDKHHEGILHQRQVRSRIEAILNSDILYSVYQPIIHISKQTVVGFEALSRFRGMDIRPETAFKEANQIGLGSALEIMAIQRALKALEDLDADIVIAVNVSPDTLLDPTFTQIFSATEMHRITLEITEHSAVERYQEIQSALAPLRRDGMQLAVDDAGSGFASFRHILELAPDKIKIDACLTHNIENDPSRRALAAAFVRFAKDTGSRLIAEGIETSTQRNALEALGIVELQGNFLGRPLPLNEARTFSL